MRLTKKVVDALVNDPQTTIQSLSDDDIGYIILKANQAYHGKADPIFSDVTYDTIVDALRLRNSNHPALHDVGSKPKANKVELPYYMGSMDKNKGDEKTLISFKNKFPGQYVISEKLDGVSALLHITNYGEDIALFTRGDGSVGQQITSILRHIKGISSDLKSLAKTRGIEQLTIRGELILTKDDFESLKSKGTNPRNMVAGVVNAKTPQINILKCVHFVAYSMIEPQYEPIKQLEYINSMGIDTVYFQALHQSGLTFEHLSEILIERRSKSQFEIDGIIVSHNEYHPIKKNANPDHAFAFKSILTQENAEVVVTGVEWNISKDGFIVPVVLLTPVHISGVTIQRTSGFNGEYISRNVIGPGSRVLLTRSGEVIPYIVSVISPASSGKAQMPEFEYTWTESGKDIIATSENKEQRLKILENFFTKAEIQGVRTGTILKLYNSGFTTVSKIVNASVDDLMKVDGFQRKTAETLVKTLSEAIANLKCLKLMEASNSFGRGFGEKRLLNIIETIPQLEDYTSKYVPTIDELIAIDGVSTKTAELFLQGLAKFREFIKKEGLTCSPRMKKVSIASTSSARSTKKEDTKKQDAKFDNEVIVFTGFRNAVLKAKIEELGGRVADTITGKTTILVTKTSDASSTKTEKAQAAGIKIISLETLQKMLQ
jgi:NAD-dependent DNA ligase